MNYTSTARLFAAQKSDLKNTDPDGHARSSCRTPAISESRILNVAFDVGSESLNWSMEPGGRTINGKCRNHSRDIRKAPGAS